MTLDDSQRALCLLSQYLANIFLRKNKTHAAKIEFLNHRCVTNVASPGKRKPHATLHNNNTQKVLKCDEKKHISIQSRFVSSNLFENSLRGFVRAIYDRMFLTFRCWTGNIAQQTLIGCQIEFLTEIDT